MGWNRAMAVNLNAIGQIALGVSDVDRSEQFYGSVLGLRHLYRFGDLTFFDCAGVRLMLEKAHEGVDASAGSFIYFRCPDLHIAVAELEKRGVGFSLRPHLIARMDDHDLWMAFCADPDGHQLALMQEARKGWTPNA